MQLQAPSCCNLTSLSPALSRCSSPVHCERRRSVRSVTCCRTCSTPENVCCQSDCQVSRRTMTSTGRKTVVNRDKPSRRCFLGKSQKTLGSRRRTSQCHLSIRMTHQHFLQSYKNFIFACQLLELCVLCIPTVAQPASMPRPSKIP